MFAIMHSTGNVALNATLWCLSVGRGQLHVCHLVSNYMCCPRVQVCVFNETATIWCFLEERIVASLLLGTQLQMSPRLQLCGV